MTARTVLAFVVAMTGCAAISCGSDDDAEMTPAVDASSEAADAAAPDAGEAGVDASAPDAPDAPDAPESDTSVQDTSPVDTATLETAAEATSEAAADASANLVMAFQHATGYGVTGWNADGTGKEPAKTGYAIPQPYAACLPSGSAVALAYVASSDYDGIVAGCPGAVQGNPGEPPIGFGSFVAALATHNKSLTDLAIRFDPLVLDSPASFPGSPEHRLYKGGTFVFYLSSEPMVQAKGDTVEMVVDYQDGANCGDDVIESKTSALTVTDVSSSSSASVQALAAAFLADVAGRPVQLTFVGFQALAPFSGTAAGRTGATFSVGGGAVLELAP